MCCNQFRSVCKDISSLIVFSHKKSNNDNKNKNKNNFFKFVFRRTKRVDNKEVKTPHSELTDKEYNKEVKTPHSELTDKEYKEEVKTPHSELTDKEYKEEVKTQRIIGQYDTNTINNGEFEYEMIN